MHSGRVLSPARWKLAAYRWHARVRRKQMKVGAILAHKTIRVGSYRKMLGGRTPGGGGWESHKVPAIGHVSLPRTRPERELISCFGRRLKQGTRARIRYTVTASRVRYCGGTCHRRTRLCPIGRIGAVETPLPSMMQHRDGRRSDARTNPSVRLVLVVVADPNQPCWLNVVPPSLI